MNQRKELQKELVSHLNEKSTSTLRVNYHAHPEIGGMGHVSMESTIDEERVQLSVYPDYAGSSLLYFPLSFLSFFVLPMKAVNKNISNDHEGCSPIRASYEVAALVPDHKKAHEEMKQIIADIESGKTAFSIVPNWLSTGLQAIKSPHVSLSAIQREMKLFDRTKIEKQLKNAKITNCAHSVSQVLVAGGHEKPDGIFSYPAPTKINSFFERRVPNSYTEESQSDHSLRAMDVTKSRRSDY